MPHPLDKYITLNLRYRPAFFAYIRPQEAVLFEKYRHYIRGTSLDFGCGDGFFAESVFGKRAIDIGLDVPTSRVQIAIKKKSYRKIIVYDGQNIPLKNASVQSVVSNCVFEHIPSIEESVSEIRRILRKNGYLLTSVMCSKWNTNLAGSTYFGKPYTDWFNRVQDHNALYSKSQWSALFKRAGFSIVAADDYLFREASRLTELHHFTSLFSLIRFKLTGRWTSQRMPRPERVFAIRSVIERDTKNPSACFYVLRKM